MGEIRVRLYGPLNKFDEKRNDKEHMKYGFLLNINEPANVEDVLKILKIPVKDVHIISINKARVKLDAPLKDGDTLHLFPLMGGG